MGQGFFQRNTVQGLVYIAKLSQKLGYYISLQNIVKKKVAFFQYERSVKKKRQEDRNNAFFLVLNNCTKYFVKKKCRTQNKKIS